MNVNGGTVKRSSMPQAADGSTKLHRNALPVTSINAYRSSCWK